MAEPVCTQRWALLPLRSANEQGGCPENPLFRRMQAEKTASKSRLQRELSRCVNDMEQGTLQSLAIEISGIFPRNFAGSFRRVHTRLTA